MVYVDSFISKFVKLKKLVGFCSLLRSSAVGVDVFRWPIILFKNVNKNINRLILIFKRSIFSKNQIF